MLRTIRWLTQRSHRPASGTGSDYAEGPRPNYLWKPGPPHAHNRRMTASELITREVTAWPGVQAGPGRRGEFAFKLGRREIGHLHGDHAAHFMFSKELGTELRRQGRVVDHPVFPGKVGPAARRIESEHDVDDVIALMRLNYERLAGTAPVSGDPAGTR